jgi:predicted flavoprotein YhiN
LRDAIAEAGEAVLSIDLRPDVGVNELTQRLNTPRGKQSVATFLRKTLALAPPAIGLMQEAAFARGWRLNTLDAASLAALVKAVPVRLVGVAPIVRAISTAGGIAWDEIDEHFMLRRMPGVFVAGEMLDWEAPTGGYLLQASFATGVAAGHGALAWLACEHGS